MPLRWKRGENPYRVNYFGILQLGPRATRSEIIASRENLTKRVSRGGVHRVGGREISEADLTEAESGLVAWNKPSKRAAEYLLVHPLPTAGQGRLASLRAQIKEAAIPARTAPLLRLTNLAALAPLIPTLDAADITRPSWDELPVPAPTSSEDLRADVQFDL